MAFVHELPWRPGIDISGESLTSTPVGRDASACARSTSSDMIAKHVTAGAGADAS